MRCRRADCHRPTRTNLPSQVVRRRNQANHKAIASHWLKAYVAVAPETAEWLEHRKRTRGIATLVPLWSAERMCTGKTRDRVSCPNTCDVRGEPVDRSSSNPPD